MRLFPITKAGMFKLASMLVIFGFIVVPSVTQAQAGAPIITSANELAYPDTVQVSINPSAPKVGENVTVTLNVAIPQDKLKQAMGDAPAAKLPGYSYSINILTPKDGGQTSCEVSSKFSYKNCSSFLEFGAKPIQGMSVSFLPDPKYFQVGQTKRLIVAVTTTALKNQSDTILTDTNIYFFGYFDLKLADNPNADPNGSASVTITSTTVNGEGTTKKYHVTYVPAPNSGVTVASVTYNCGFSGNTDQTISGLNFDCLGKQTNPNDTLVFKPSVKLKLSNGQVLDVSVTGDSNNAGSYNNETNFSNNSIGLLGLVNKILAAVLTLILQIVYAIFWFVIVPLLQSILSIRTYQDSFANVIYPGWEIIRNLCNIAFVVAMLWMGLSQIFGFDSFNYKKGLGKLVIAALLVNFSLIIPQTILAVSETVQNQFLPNNTKVINALGYKLMVEPMEKLAIGSSTVETLSVGSINNFGSTARIFLYFCMAVAAFFVFAAIMFNLLIRLIGLWALLLTSPVGFAGGVLPFTQSFQKQWWKYFICYATYTPVVAFMLNLTALMTDRITQGLNSAAIPNFSNSVSPNISSFVFTLLPNFLLLGFMYATISVAKMACGFAPVDKLTSKFGGRALDLASTSMSGRPDKAIVGGIGDAAKVTGVSTVRDFASRRMAAAGWHEGGDGYWAKSKKQIYTTLNADRVAKRAWERYYKEPLAEKDKKQKEAIEGMFKTYKKASVFASDAKNEAKDLYSGYALDDAEAFNKLSGKNDIKSKLKRAGLLLHAMDDPKNADAFLQGIGYSTNSEGVLKMLDKEVADGTITDDQAKEMKKRFDRSFASKNMYNKVGLRDDKGNYRTLKDLDAIKKDQVKKFQSVSNSKKESHLTKAGEPIFVEYDEKGNISLNNVGAAHIAHSQDSDREHDLVNASKLRPADKESLKNINKDPALRDSAINSILATNPSMGKPQAEKLWDDYYQASKKSPSKKSGKGGGKGKKGGGGGGATPPGGAGTPPPGSGTTPPSGGGSGTPPPGAPSGAGGGSRRTGSAPSSAGPAGPSTGSSGGLPSAAGPGAGSYTPPSAPTTPPSSSTPSPAGPSSSTTTPPPIPPTPPTPPTTASSSTSTGGVTPSTSTPPASSSAPTPSSSSPNSKVIFGGNPVTNLQNPQGPQTPPVPSHVAPPVNDVIKNYTGVDAVKDNIEALSTGFGSDPMLSGIGQTEKQTLVQGISAEMNKYHNPLSQSSGPNFVQLQNELHESLAEQIIQAKGLDQQDPSVQIKALESAKNVTKNYMKDVHNL